MRRLDQQQGGSRLVERRGILSPDIIQLNSPFLLGGRTCGEGNSRNAMIGVNEYRRVIVSIRAAQFLDQLAQQSNGASGLVKITVVLVAPVTAARAAIRS